MEAKTITKHVLKFPIYMLRAYFGGCINKGLFIIELLLTLLLVALHYTTPGGLIENYFGMIILVFTTAIWMFHLIMTIPNLVKKETYR